MATEKQAVFAFHTHPRARNVVAGQYAAATTSPQLGGAQQIPFLSEWSQSKHGRHLQQEQKGAQSRQHSHQTFTQAVEGLNRAGKTVGSGKRTRQRRGSCKPSAQEPEEERPEFKASWAME